MMKKLCVLLVVSTCVMAAQAAVSYDQDVTPDVIFGSGNENGSFTVDRVNSVELGLRGKLRHDENGYPANIFNSNGDGTYTFNAGVAPTQSSPTAEWSFEWSINTDYTGTSGLKLDDLTYELAMTSSTGAFIAAFDPINGINQGLGRIQWDHSIGDNSTTAATDLSLSNAVNDETLYLSRIGSYNVAQNSWKPHWFVGSFDPTLTGTYTFTLKAFDGTTEIASDAITVNVVPEPASLALLGLGGLLLRRKK